MSGDVQGVHLCQKRVRLSRVLVDERKPLPCGPLLCSVSWIVRDAHEFAAMLRAVRYGLPYISHHVTVRLHLRRGLVKLIV